MTISNTHLNGLTFGDVHGRLGAALCCNGSKLRCLGGEVKTFLTGDVKMESCLARMVSASCMGASMTREPLVLPVAGLRGDIIVPPKVPLLCVPG
jgi:hypothetical protein